MMVEEKTDTHTLMVRLPIDLGRDNMVELEQVFERGLQEGLTKFEIDASNVEYMTSGGIGVLVGLLVRLRKVGGDLCIRNVTPSLAELFEFTKLNKIFNIQ